MPFSFNCCTNGSGILGAAQVTYILSYGACFSRPSDPSEQITVTLEICAFKRFSLLDAAREGIR